MTYRIGWLSPMTPASGIGTFSHAVTQHFPREHEGEALDLTILYVGHKTIYASDHRMVRISDDQSFHGVLSLFDLLVYNVGNNREHHHPIYALLQLYPGIVICHDFVLQNYLADRAYRVSGNFSSLAALLTAFGGESASAYLKRSRFTNRLGHERYHPWGTAASVEQPMNEAICRLGSALIVHSAFAHRYAERCHTGPVARLGMPHDQKDLKDAVARPEWRASLSAKLRFEAVSYGHIQPTKCIDLVIEAIASSPTLRRRLHYSVVGFVENASHFDHLKSMVAGHSLQNCVTFEPEASEPRLAELMQRADIFVNLRRPNTEGASVSLIEQLATGKPVVVIDSGCYADIPPNSAIKLPPDATSGSIAESLERLIAQPSAMPAIGEAGRCFAQTWTCASYAETLLRFVWSNRETLEARGRCVAVQGRASHTLMADAWEQALAHARLSLTYLDLGILAIAPGFILQKSTAELCAYVASVIFGLFDNTLLDLALARFFVRLAPEARYWGCVRLALVADAAFGDNAAARDRLVNLRPCYDGEFWSVITALPARQCLTAATLLLLKRTPTDAELSTVSFKDGDERANRQSIADLVRSIERPRGSPLDELASSLDVLPLRNAEPLAIERDFEASAGSKSFSESIDLSGFYTMQEDHIWTRGKTGFLGLRLVDERPLAIEILLNHISASAERPASIRLALDRDETLIEVNDCYRRWLSFPVPCHADLSARIWLKLSTDIVAVPSQSADTRLLGLCIWRIRVSAQQSTSSEERIDW